LEVIPLPDVVGLRGREIHARGVVKIQEHGQSGFTAAFIGKVHIRDSQMAEVPLLFLEQFVVNRQAYMIRTRVCDPLEILEPDGIVQMIPLIGL
jgi:hypothetical protein